MCRGVVKHQEGLVVGINLSSDFSQKIVEKLPVHPTNTSCVVDKAICRQYSQTNCHISATLTWNLMIITFPNPRPSITSRCSDVAATFVNEDAVIDDPLRHKPVGIFIASLYNVGSVASSWYCSGHLYAYQHSIHSLSNHSITHQRFSR